MKKTFIFVLIITLLASFSVYASSEEEEKSWSEWYEEGSRAFLEGDIEKAAAAYDAAMEASGDTEIVAILMRHACVVPAKRADGLSTFSVDTQEINEHIQAINELEDDLGLLLAQKKVTQKDYQMYLEMAKEISLYLENYLQDLTEAGALQEKDESAEYRPGTGAATDTGKKGSFTIPLPAESLQERLEKPKAPSSYKEKVASTKQDGNHTVYLDKDGYLLRIEWEEHQGDSVIHGVQHYVNDQDGHPVAAFTYWNNVLVMSFNFFRLNGLYVSHKFIDQKAIQKVFKNNGHK